MAPDLIEIEPRELKFTFELKKQSSCTIQLINNTNSYVAFKIKTTSPKRYCVRPNTGVILPKSTCDFTVSIYSVTMQAQRVAPADMQLRDKFLVQSTIVPYGTTDEDLVPSLFSKETGRQIEESKLRVVLVSPPHSPILQPINGAVKQELTYAAPVLNETPVLKETPLVSDQELTQDENLHPSHDPKDVDDLKQKLGNLEVKLLEAEKTMSKLREEKNAAVQEKEKLQHDIASITNKEVRGSGSSRLSLSVCGFHRACQSGTWISFTSMNENCIGNEVTTLGRDIFLHQRLLQPGKLSKQLFLVLNI